MADRNDVLSADEVETLGINEAAIRGLRHEAELAGDDKQVQICETALCGYRWAVVECKRAIDDAAAQVD